MALNDNFPRNGLRLCIDEDGDQPLGRFYFPIEKEEYRFRGMGDFLLQADKVFEKHHYPQSFVQKRTFLESDVDTTGYRGIPDAICAVELKEQKGQSRTFNLIITSRRNATWQGILQDGDGNKLGEFQGEMELLELLNRDTMRERTIDF